MPPKRRKFILGPISPAAPGTLYQQIVDGLKREVSENGVALRFPPQPMTRWVGGRLARGGVAIDGIIKFLAAGRAGAWALAGAYWRGQAAIISAFELTSALRRS